jgi:hypothetical protein
MLPLDPGDEIDSTPWNVPGGLQGGTFPDGDDTANDDGWGAFSGTSAAAPQLAGVAALIKQACPRLGPAQIRSIMMSTARDVTVGNGHPRTGGVAAVGPDTATGNGLVDAQRAVAVAKIRCLPIHPPSPPLVPTPPQPPVITTPVPPIPPVPPPIIPPIVPPIPPIQPPGPPPAASGVNDTAASGTAFGVTEEEIEILEGLVRENPDFELE